MRDANSVSTPMTKGFIVSLQDSPTTPAAQRAVINYVNTTFGRKYTLYAEVVSFYGHLISSIGWITHRVGPIMQHAHSVLGSRPDRLHLRGLVRRRERFQSLC